MLLSSARSPTDPDGVVKFASLFAKVTAITKPHMGDISVIEAFQKGTFYDRQRHDGKIKGVSISSEILYSSSQKSIHHLVGQVLSLH